jgi:hypothetical protein
MAAITRYEGGGAVDELEVMRVSTAALVESAKKIAAALAEIDASPPGNPTVRTFRDRLQSAHQVAVAGAGPFDELNLLDTLTTISNDWMKQVDRSALQTEVYALISEARNPLKAVRNSYPAFDPPPEAINLDYWCDKQG